MAAHFLPNLTYIVLFRLLLGFNPLWKGNLLTSWIQVVSKNPTGVDGASKGFSQHMFHKVFRVANIYYSKANLDDVAGRFLPYMNTELK